jgi:hypothetical protein
MPQETPSPLDLPEPEWEPESALGWASGVIVVATLVLLLANAVSLRDWIDDQPPSPFQAQAAEIADQWVGISRQIGFGVPRDALHRQWKRAEGARFTPNGMDVPEGEGADLPDGG